MQKIGFIGTGVMGTGIINNLLKAGYDVTVYNRTKAHAQPVMDNGAHWADSPAEVAAATDITISMVGFPQDVENIYFGDEGILAGATTGQLVVDMTTSTPTLARKIAAAASARGVIAVDAPVSGGDVGAKNGTLTVMVGGDPAVMDTLKPIFDVIAGSVHRFGDAGMGQHAKIANQIMIAGTMTGLTEMLVYARATGLNLDDVLATVGAGSAANWSLTNYGPRVLKGDYTPGFFAKHFLKDLRIALDEADKLGLDLPATKTAKQLYAQLVDAGHGNDGTQALVKLYAAWTK
ncbi:NAD(P)-dependent oxidoreductase [Lacticaseibacillus thailandensis]|uniref:2-hydroxyacid dehydrogenase n=1 Tax=Lacticaseibacillus thailandensis DSM 22698 = JCM 13996 TaxID=1423810 RepID=A0A0R2CFD2_9LACO|nr:NAD(P)-dependent oxidoreductase [Lacticaseibacillus thailandensis]KRM87051.1 2-hydroxyacid dehydrogenase [Lacticaseibacillus thailandensis DSM 22698 = JCM 13996]